MARRSGLGRGLGALIPPEVRQHAESELRDIPVADIRPNPNQPRSHFDDEMLASLTDSIRSVGVLQPILVRDTGGEFELIAGERRWRAAKRAGLQTIPALVRSVGEESTLEQALVENVQRQDLNAIEEAHAYQQLIEHFQLTQEQVAQRVGKSRSTVANFLRLLQLPPGIQRLVVEGQLSGAHARAVLGTPDRAYQEALAKRAVAEGMSVRAVEEAVRARSGRDTPAGGTGAGASAGASGAPTSTAGSAAPDRPRAKLPEPGLAEVEKLLSEHLDTRVAVEMGSKKGRIIVDFADLEDLERIYRRMNSVR